MSMQKFLQNRDLLKCNEVQYTNAVAQLDIVMALINRLSLTTVRFLEFRTGYMQMLEKTINRGVQQSSEVFTVPYTVGYTCRSLLSNLGKLQSAKVQLLCCHLRPHLLLKRDASASELA